MSVVILHLSDIHFKTGHNIILNRSEKIFDSIKNEIKGKDYFFIITSGDIAFSGQKEEYNIAKKFYTTLIEKISAYTGLESKLLFVPGNHDCLFDKDIEEIRTMIIEKFAKNGLDHLNENLITKCCEPQKNYFDFVSEMYKISDSSLENADNILNHQLTQVVTFKIDNAIVKFNLYNTSWVSSIQERIGTLRFPIQYMDSKIGQAESLISISVLHHPLNWQTPEYSQNFLDFLLKTSDIIFTGHEHSPQATRRSDIDNEYNTIHIESPALQESDNPTSAFNIINLDIKKMEIQVVAFKYDESVTNNYIRKESGDWKKIEKIKKLKSKDFQIKNEFRKKLEDPGAKYTHATAETITLESLFVDPFFQRIDLDKEKIKTKSLHFDTSSNVLSISDSSPDKFLKVILGAEYSGKTTVLKYHYLKLYEQNYFPVYISSENINGVDLEKIKKIVSKEFLAQYDELDKEYKSIDFKKLIIIIDDFHKFTNTKAKVILLNNLQKLFEKILITGNELMMFESFKDSQGKPFEPYENFEWYSIKEFNPSLRAELITKWYRLGREYMDREERNEFFRKIDFAQNNVTDIIGKNFVPSYPVYLLAILQGLESGDSNGSSTKQHAYYYELLITNSLKKILSDKDDIGFYMTFGKEYFYFLFKEKIRFKPISTDDFFIFLNNHKIEYSISKLNNDQVFDVLTKSRILKKDSDNNVTPSYKYLYYYFVAKYMADNLDEEAIQSEIDLMADRVYRDEFSNIIVFLIHLARNNYVIKKLIEKSKAIYATQIPVKLEGDIGFINKLQTAIPEEILKEVDIEDARDRDLKNQDVYEEMETQIDEVSLNEDYELNEDISNLDEIAIITKAVRTIDILGQLTKKYWGELKGDHKYNLAEETFLLGLRVLSFHFTLIDGNIEGLVEHIKKIVLKKHRPEDITTTEIKSISGNFIFSLCATSAFAILKRIVSAIGTEKLIDTYNKIEENHPYNSISIANAAIKLDHFSNFPMPDLQRLKDKNEKNILAMVVLRKFLIEHMYMYDLGYEKKQQLCDMFGIKMEEQRLISSSSPIKK